MSSLAKLHRAFELATEAIYDENEIGGEARGLVMDIGRVVGVDLTKDIIDHTWSPANMRRVLRAVEGLRAENARLAGRALGQSVPLLARGW